MTLPQDVKDRRERIATAILANFAAIRTEAMKDPDGRQPGPPEAAVSLAIAWADALIDALDKAASELPTTGQPRRAP